MATPEEREVEAPQDIDEDGFQDAPIVNDLEDLIENEAQKEEAPVEAPVDIDTPLATTT